MTLSLSNYLAADSAASALRRDVLDGLGGAPKTLPPSGSTTPWEATCSTRSPAYRSTTRRVPRPRSCGAGDGHRGALGCRHAGRTRQWHVGEDPAAARRVPRMPARCGGSSGSTSMQGCLAPAAGAAIGEEYPGVEIDAVCGDFEHHLGKIPRFGRRLVAFLGSTIGNLTNRARGRTSSARCRRTCNPVTPCCSAPIWSRTSIGWCAPTTTAPESPRGSNKNVLAVVNRELGADFDLEDFAHVARWNADEERIENVAAGNNSATGSRRRSRTDRRVRGGRGDAHRGVVQVPARGGGGRARRGRVLRRTNWWTDPAGDFGLSLAVEMSLATAWREARPPVAGVHLDSAALLAADLRRAGRRGPARVARGEVARLCRGRARPCRCSTPAGPPSRPLTGFAAGDVVFAPVPTTPWTFCSATGVGPAPWPATPASSGPTSSRWRGTVSTLLLLPVDPSGRLTPTTHGPFLAADPPALVHFTALGSHRGIVQPVSAVAATCRELGIPLIDSTPRRPSRTSTAPTSARTRSIRRRASGPRGPAGRGDRRPRGPGERCTLARIADAEATYAAQVGYSIALGEHLAVGPIGSGPGCGRGRRDDPHRGGRRGGVAGRRTHRRAQERHHHDRPARRCRPPDLAGQVDRRTPDRHHLYAEVERRAARDGPPGAAVGAARRPQRRRPGCVRGGAGDRDGRRSPGVARRPACPSVRPERDGAAPPSRRRWTSGPCCDSRPRELDGPRWPLDFARTERFPTSPRPTSPRMAALRPRSSAPTANGCRHRCRRGTISPGYGNSGAARSCSRA